MKTMQELKNEYISIQLTKFELITMYIALQGHMEDEDFYNMSEIDKAIHSDTVETLIRGVDEDSEGEYTSAKRKENCELMLQALKRLSHIAVASINTQH